MKRVMKFVLAMAMVLMMSGGAMAEDFAAQGTCLIPHVVGHRSSAEWTVTRVHLSNITDSAIQCDIVLYDQNGNNVSGYGDIYSISSDGVNWAHISAGGNVFEIPAHSTRMMEFTRGGLPNRIMGYGVVKWKSTDPMKQKALVGSVRFHTANSIHAYGGEQFLNNGNPF
ncbi:hypothetical protein [Maridesulfovibrio sp. FT414]|uniref:hypothetical protein n=1 Tax=Maridesulfovibrio sp. FT414 TaxID=2979469 RepID=UPI003D801112